MRSGVTNVLRTLGFAWLLAPVLATAQPDPAEICDSAAQQVARDTGVPLDVLRAITRTETGRGKGLRPWPWTVNMEGKGIWFDTEDQARRYVFRHFKAGARSFDIGCFQINYRWHGQAFNSIEEMFDPLLNARYAAQFLQRLEEELGDWTQAAGAYHSRTRKFAQRYISRYSRIRANLDGAPPPRLRAPRSNRFPLLRQVGGPATRGSLVPLEQTGPGPGLFAPRIGQ